ncbi:EF-P 5-aminopentanol modification-associated protein YfmH [Gorillibacterium timonense]|uniref:EF-P 5-aminopentanol modification-associated protein YfmH n=1 Tax=Gorillibacterium timonense TaxID=1689269 RepID=UPI00071D69A5|nr:pitrilysin family protein [Gorillibacterium timonense]
MDVIQIDRLQEKLYKEELPNGLTVYVLPKPGFSKTYATFTTDFGSVDNHFRLDGGKDIRVPDGIAHFLEHKMFEEPEGDIFATFASHGASANAFTGFERTTYLFSATDHVYENLKTLVDFVQHPYFTDQNVEKEKGIIGQEIKMYDDNPDWRSYFGLISAMYQEHPVRIDIAGTVETISHIDKETLYECYKTFYHPSNMILFVVGGVEPEKVFDLVRANQAAKNYEPQGAIERLQPQEPAQVGQKKVVVHLPVSLPKMFFGFKEPSGTPVGEKLVRRELAVKVMLDALLGPSTPLYQSLYDEHLISDSFGHEYNLSPDYAFSIIGGDTPDPDRLLARFRERIEPVLASGISEADFERTRRKRIGSYLRMLNSPEAIANEFTRYRFSGGDLFELLPLYDSLTLDEINGLLREHFDWNRLAVCIVRSEEA